MPGSARTSTTHYSRIARRLDRETGMGYQKALTMVRAKAHEVVGRLPRLDAAGCDLALRGLLRQDVEFWGPGIGAHLWPDVYHPLSMTWQPARFCPEAMVAAERWRDERPEQCGVFDPSYLAEAGVEPLDYGDGPGDADDVESIDPALLEPVDEPDRWKRHVLTQGPRPAFRLPAAQSLSHETRTEASCLDPAQARARLEQLIEEEPAAVEGYVLRADLALADAEGSGRKRGREAVAEARRWYECAVAVGEPPLLFCYDGVLLWREEANRPLLKALYGLAVVAHRQQRWNTAEMILFRLLRLDPNDPLGGASLLAEVRAAVGLPAPPAK